MSRVQWRPRNGRCAVCGRRGRIVFHHIVYGQHVKALGGDVWDFRNALAVGAPLGRCRCHDNHHHPGVNGGRIPRSLLPEVAVQFAVDLMGEDRANAYLARYYGPDREETAHAADRER